MTTLACMCADYEKLQLRHIWTAACDALTLLDHAEQVGCCDCYNCSMESCGQAHGHLVSLFCTLRIMFAVCASLECPLQQCI